MPAVSTKAALSNMFKDRYFEGDLSRHGDVKTPLGDIITKRDDFYGNSLIFPFNFAGNESIGPTLDAVNPAPQSSYFDKWTVTDYTTMYARLSIHTPSAMRAGKDVGSYLRLKAKETQGLLRSMKERRLGHQVWGDGASDIGQLAANTTGASPTVALTVQGDSVKFKKGMKLQANAVRTGSAATMRTDVYMVVKRELLSSAGTTKLTLSRVSGAADDWAANDYVYPYGFYDSAMKGVRAWITDATPGTGGVPATLFGMDRTDEPEMKAGWRGIWQGSIHETILHLTAVMGQYFDPNFSSIWLSNYNWFRLSQELRSLGMLCYDDEASLKFGTKVITFAGPSGDIKVVADPFCPNTDVFCLRHGDIEIITLGPLIHICDEDLEALRLSDDDGLEIRYRSLAEMVMPYPFHCGRAPIAA